MASRVQSVRWAFNCASWTPTEQDLLTMSGGIDAEDKKEVAKFVFQNDAKRALVGRYLTKKFLTEVSGLAWKEVNVLRDLKNNKPYFPKLVDNKKIQFNISHSGDFVVLAGEVGNLDLGVDLMKVEKQRATSVSEFFRLMTSQFGPEEWSAIKSRNTEPEQMEVFYRYWCLKESYTKATGTGITVDLQKICFRPKTLNLSHNSIVRDTVVFVDGKIQEGWQFEESMVDNEHIVVVAMFNAGSDFVPQGGLFKLVSFPELMSNCQQISETDVGYSRNFVAKRKRL